MEKKIVKYSGEELKNKKGATHWATLVKKNKSPNKTFKKDAQKRRAF